jgi:predicted RNase H-like HicB family nuclease
MAKSTRVGGADRVRVWLDLDVQVHKAAEGGYWAEVKSLPGCYSQGETRAELSRNIREAISCHIEALSAIAARSSEVVKRPASGPKAAKPQAAKGKS